MRDTQHLVLSATTPEEDLRRLFGGDDEHHHWTVCLLHHAHADRPKSARPTHVSVSIFGLNHRDVGLLFEMKGIWFRT